MDVADLLRAHGGCMRSTQIKAHVSARALRRAVADGEILRVAMGTYMAPDSDAPPVLALQLRGVLSHGSAARKWGFALPPGGGSEHVTIPHKARRKSPLNVVLHYRDLDPREVRGHATSPLQTVIDCLRDLCLAEALADARSGWILGRRTRSSRRAGRS